MFYKLFEKKRKIPFRVQINQLKELGVNLNQEVELKDIFQHFEQKEIEKEPYVTLLIALGNEIERNGAWIPLSTDIWYFDTECIEDHGIYVDIMMRLSNLTHGYLKINDLDDFVDVENKKAWVSFFRNSKYYKWDLHVDEDWFDFSLIQRLNDILDQDESDKKFSVAVIDQSCLICFLSPDQLDKINELSRLEFEYE